MRSKSIVRLNASGYIFPLILRFILRMSERHCYSGVISSGSYSAVVIPTECEASPLSRLCLSQFINVLESVLLLIYEKSYEDVNSGLSAVEFNVSASLRTFILKLVVCSWRRSILEIKGLNCKPVPGGLPRPRLLILN